VIHCNANIRGKVKDEGTATSWLEGICSSVKSKKPAGGSKLGSFGSGLGAALASAANAGGDAKLPDEWPKEVPVYSGAKRSASSSESGNYKTMSITISTPDNADTILDFYEKEFKKVGWKKSSSSKTKSSSGDMNTVSYQKGAGFLGPRVTLTTMNDFLNKGNQSIIMSYSYSTNEKKK
jgi:hypothetical protein